MINDYKCMECGAIKEVFNKSLLPEIFMLCKSCRKTTLHKKLFPKSNFILKGTGFHKTDYKNV